MYSDFFAPPPKLRRDKGKGRAVPNNGSAPTRDSKVRFHEEVRVKMVKSHGNMNSLYEADNDSDDEDMEGVDIADQDEQEVADSLDEDDGEEEDAGEESGEGEGDEDSEEQDEGAFETMERFKDDLFEDEGPDETSKSFPYTDLITN
jgi:U3 small nucleolar RNA-associated protein MPP10